QTLQAIYWKRRIPNGALKVRQRQGHSLVDHREPMPRRIDDPYRFVPFFRIVGEHREVAGIARGARMPPYGDARGRLIQLDDFDVDEFVKGKFLVDAEGA